MGTASIKWQFTPNKFHISHDKSSDDRINGIAKIYIERDRWECPVWRDFHIKLYNERLSVWHRLIRYFRADVSEEPVTLIFRVAYSY
jgi:hypothetical protein